MSITQFEKTLKILEASIGKLRFELDAVKQNSSIDFNVQFTVLGCITLESLTQQYIQYAMNQCNGNQTQCAKLLGISRSSLWRHLSNGSLENSH